MTGFSLVLSLVTAVFLTLFLMIDLPRLIGAVDSLLDPRGSERWGRMSERIITAVSRTMLGNIAISIICGTIYGVSAWLLGTPVPGRAGRHLGAPRPDPDGRRDDRRHDHGARDPDPGR